MMTTKTSQTEKFSKDIVVSTAMSGVNFFSVAIVSICFLAHTYTGHLFPLFAYNQQNFHWWQLISAHFIHYDTKHLSLNMLALIILLYIFPQPQKQLTKGLILSIFFIGFYLTLSKVAFYAGFSGLLYVIPGMALGRYIIHKRYWYCFRLLGVYLAYMIFTKEAGHSSVNITWSTLIQAHFIGLASGVFIKIKEAKRNN